MSAAWRPALLWPLLAAATVRLACLPLGARIEPSGDAAGYVYLAREFAESGRFAALAVGVRPPLFRMLLAPGFDRSVQPFDPFPGLYLIQIGIDLAALALLVAVTRGRFGERAAAATGWIYAFYPPSILYASGVIMAESIAVLATAAALLALDRLDRALDDRAARLAPHVIVLGLVLGVGILSKEFLVPITAVIGVALLLRPGIPLWRRAGLALVTGGIALLVTVPWLAYTQQRHGIPVLSGTLSDWAYCLDNEPPGETNMHLTKRMYVADDADRRALSHEIFRRALFEYPALTASRALIRARIAAGPEDMLPGWVASAFDDRIVDGSSNFAMSRDLWTLTPGSWGRRVQVVCGIGAVLLFAFGAAGLALTGRGALVRTTLLATLVVILILALTVASARYRQMLVPFYAPFAGVAVAALLSRGRSGESANLAPETQQHGARRAAVCGLVVAVLLTVTIFLLPAP